MWHSHGILQPSQRIPLPPASSQNKHNRLHGSCVSFQLRTSRAVCAPSQTWTMPWPSKTSTCGLALLWLRTRTKTVTRMSILISSIHFPSIYPSSSVYHPCIWSSISHQGTPKFFTRFAAFYFQAVAVYQRCQPLARGPNLAREVTPNDYYGLPAGVRG